MQIADGYKQTEVGTIPTDWDVDELQSVCRHPITYGIVQCGPNVESGVPYIRVSDMSGSKLDVSTMLRTSSKIAAGFSRSTVREDEIVYALRGLIGHVQLVPADVDGANLTQGTARVSPNDRVDSIFLFWALRSTASLRQANLDAKGSTFREITLAEIRKVEVPIPPLAEQRAIAEALSDVDALMNALDALITKKRQIKQGTMQQLLTGKKRLPGFSGEWEETTLGELCSSITDGTHYTPRYVDTGVPFYSVENVTQQNFSNTKFISVEEHNDLIRRCKPERGDILLTRIGSLGDTKLIDWDVNASIYVSLALLKPKNDTCPEYLYAYSKSRQFIIDVEKRSLLNAAPKKINMKDIGEVPIHVPPSLEEQARIAEVLSDMGAEITALEAKRDKTRLIKQGMMQQLLTGKTRLVA